jgi:hypothetical protein
VNDSGVTLPGCHLQRRFAGMILGVCVGFESEQQLDGLDIAATRRQRERATTVSELEVSRSTAFQQGSRARQMTAERRGRQWR